MAIVRTTRFTLEPTMAGAMLELRRELLQAVRTAFSGPAETRLVRIDAETWVDAWRWDSPETLRVALAGAPGLPESAAAFAMVSNPSVEEGHVADEDVWAR